MRYYPRFIESLIHTSSQQFRIIVLTGARQSGKSTLLRQLFGKTHRYITFDDPKMLRLAKQDPELFLSEYPAPLILDEIQYVPELLPYLKIIVDQNPLRGQFILTGSQQFTLIKNLQETLAGRAAIFQLGTMSVFEGASNSHSYEYRALRGSFPEITCIHNIDPDVWYRSYINTYIEKDIQSYFRLEKISYFKDLLFLLAARTSQILNYQSLANDIGVSSMIIKSWVHILESSGIIYLLRPYYVNLGSRITKSPKLYFTDIGLVSYLTGIRLKETLMQGPQAGAIFENFIVQELIKLYENAGMTPPLYYLRTNNGLEIDLLIEKKLGDLLACEIKLSKTPNEGHLKNIKLIRALNKNPMLSIGPAKIISFAEDKFALSSTDYAYPWLDFLKEIQADLTKS